MGKERERETGEGDKDREIEIERGKEAGREGRRERETGREGGREGGREEGRKGFTKLGTNCQDVFFLERGQFQGDTTLRCGIGGGCPAKMPHW